MTATAQLADEDLAILRFAGQWWADPAARDQAIRERFGISPVRFHQRLAHLVKQPAAQAAEPVIVGRLRRIVAARRTRTRTPWSTR